MRRMPMRVAPAGTPGTDGVGGGVALRDADDHMVVGITLGGVVGPDPDAVDARLASGGAHGGGLASGPVRFRVSVRVAAGAYGHAGPDAVGQVASTRNVQPAHDAGVGPVGADYLPVRQWRDARAARIRCDAQCGGSHDQTSKKIRIGERKTNGGKDGEVTSTCHGRGSPRSRCRPTATTPTGSHPTARSGSRAT